MAEQPIPQHNTMREVLAEIAAEYDPDDTSKARVFMTLRDQRSQWGRIAHVGEDLFALQRDALPEPFGVGRETLLWMRIDNVLSVARSDV